MPRFGQYQTVSEIHRSGLGSVWSARSEADSRVRFAIKTCMPDVDIAGYEQAEAAVRLFIEQAAVQQKLGRATDSVWAPLHEYGRLTAEDAAATAQEAGEEAPPAGSVPPVGAYSVSDLCARSSLERVLASRVKLDARGIAAILRAVVTGLRQITQVGGRPHGNLRPTNVLLSGDGELSGLRVLLADPLPTSRVQAQRDEQADVRAVGELMCALVTLQPFRERGAGGTASESPEWNRLPGGSKWRELCNQLLDTDPTRQRMTLEEIEQAIERLSAPPGVNKKFIFIGVAAALVAVGVSIPVYFNHREKQRLKQERLAEVLRQQQDQTRVAWETLCREYKDWFGLFIKDLEKKPPTVTPAGTAQAPVYATRRELYRADPYLKPLIDPLPSDPDVLFKIAGVGRMNLDELGKQPPADVVGAEGIRQTAQLAEQVQRLKDGLGGAGWALLATCSAGATTLEQYGLAQEAKWMRDLAEGVRPGEGRVLSKGIDAVLAAAPTVTRLGEQLAGIQRRKAVLTASGDAVQVALAGWLEGQAKRPGKPEGVTLQDIQDLARDLDAADQLAQRVDKFLGDKSGEGWDNTDKELYQRNGTVYAALARGEKPTAELFAAWLREAGDYRKIDPSLDPRRAGDTQVLLAEVRKSGEALEKDWETPLAPEVAARIEKLAADQASLVSRPFDATTRASIDRDYALLKGALAEVRLSLGNQIETVRASRAANAGELRDRLKRTSQIVPRGEEVNKFWVAERDKLMAAFPDEQFKALGRVTQSLHEALTKLDAAVPAGLDAGAQPAEWMAAISQESWLQRDRAIDEALNAWRATQTGNVDPTAQSFAEMQASVSQQYTAWLTPARKLADDLRAADSMLAEAYGLNEPGPDGKQLGSLAEGWKDAPLLKVAAVAGKVAPITSRIGALADLERAGDPVALAEIVGAADAKPERRLGAWRRLSSASPAWPSTLAQLRQEPALERQVEQIVSGIRADDRRTRLGAELAAEKPARWKRCFAALTAPADIEAAAGMARDFAVDAGTLPGPQQYNLLLAGFKQASAENIPEDQAGALIQGFAQRAAALDGVGARPEVAALLGPLNQLVDPNKIEPPKTPTTKLGPGSLPDPNTWTGDDQGPSLTFTRSSKDGRTKVTLYFLRVDKDETGKTLDDPFYLSATEVSLREFINIVELNSAWPEVRKALFAFDPERADSERSGPCVWTVPSNRLIAVCGEWLRGNRAMVSGKHPAYPDELRNKGDPTGRAIAEAFRPKDDHPMQQLSPGCALLVARLAGCQLPTSAQWKAAYIASLQDGQDRVVNLRDATWQKQYDHIKATHGALQREGSSSFEGFNWPDDGAFPRSEADKAKPDPAAKDDGYLWFAPVGSDNAKEGFHHLRGNVAEFVVDAPPPPAGDPVSNAAIVRFLKSNKGQIGVIGGSALSSPDPPGVWQKAQRVEDLGFKETEADQGYADVGFRLAFSAKGSAPPRVPLAQQAREKLDALGRYLAPQ